MADRGIYVGARARIALDSWAGTSLHGWAGGAVEIVAVTPKKARVRALVTTRLAGRRRFLHPGEVALVPREALRPTPLGAEYGGPAASAEDLT